jgi:predicted membrane-bound mannosyltransferase
MKVYGFSFKNEAIWMLVLSLAPAIVGALILLIVWLFRQ